MQLIFTTAQVTDAERFIRRAMAEEHRPNCPRKNNESSGTASEFGSQYQKEDGRKITRD